MSRMSGVLVLVACLLVGVSGCQKEGATGRAATPAANAAGTPASAPSAPVALEDVMERDPRYIVGISYPPEARAYPGLAKSLKAYAESARAELKQAVAGLDGNPPTGPYDLSLAYSMLLETPDVVAVAADGSSYTGGAHGNPLVARFVWLPRRGEALTAARLVQDPAGWAPISAYVREALATRLSERLDEEAPTPGDRAEMLRTGARMIDEGTMPEAANFDQFEPIAGAGGRLAGLRFVFPPYQVGPYSDGVQSVEVPAAVLLPVIAPSYRTLFEGG